MKIPFFSVIICSMLHQGSPTLATRFSVVLEIAHSGAFRPIFRGVWYPEKWYPARGRPSPTLWRPGDPVSGTSITECRLCFAGRRQDCELPINLSECLVPSVTRFTPQQLGT